MRAKYLPVHRCTFRIRLIQVIIFKHPLCLIAANLLLFQQAVAIAVDHKISAAMRDWVRVSPGMRFVYDAWERKPINRTIACTGDLELQPRIDGVFAV